ncbi:MAG: hypothetical protein AAGG69_14755 [Pseudomonadota bacterium]
MKLKSALIAATVAITASTGAFAQNVELTTGIGFGQTRTQAMQEAVRAWVNQSMIDHGSADWNTAFKGPMECNQSASSGGTTTQGIGIGGDLTGSWACSVSGVPATALLPS